MTEYWEKSVVTGYAGEGVITETVLHRRGEDALVLACRRNQRLAGCRRIQVVTAEVFSEIRNDPEKRKALEDSPRDRQNIDTEWDW